jgi:3-oxoacyl-[acyl-carrier protein] reductase
MTLPRKTLLITGGSRGLGFGLVETLLADGYRIGTCSRSMTPQLDALLATHAGGGSLFWGSCTIGQSDSELAFFRSFLSWAGKESFYGLVNNAGIAKEGILATFPDIESERIINVNLLAALRLARLSLQQFLSRPGPARIVNISSIIALRGYNGLAAYSASKAGLDGLTRALAREMGRRAVTVNSVNPGYLDTEMSASLDQGQREQIVRRTPMGRLGRVADIVPVVQFLLGEGAGFITGQSLVVDGGISV